MPETGYTPDLFAELPPEELEPGFMVVHGNQPESLRDLLVAWMKRHPLAPLENELVLVQSNGVAQWLKLSLAGNAAHGGLGIAAALQTQLPARALWDVYRCVLGPDQVPPESPFDKSQMVWRLMRLLPALLAGAEFAPLRRFLQADDDGRKRHQLALRLADLLDQYQVYRADWLERWAAGDDVITRGNAQVGVPEALRWQPTLWRELLRDVGAAGAASSRARVHARFLEAVAAGQGGRPATLPRRISVFGISSLPRQALEALAAVSRWTQVLLCVHNPCEHDWSYIVSEQDVHRARRQQRRPGLRGEVADDALHLMTQPLLAAWGKQGRDFIRLLDDYDRRDAYEARFRAAGQRIDLFVPNPADSLLRQLQDDIRELRPLGETQEQWPPVDPATDRSITFHVTHGPQREVEVLHDQLLAAFTADPTLRPRDVIVMVPDIATYVPHVQAVFGLAEPGDPRHIPFTVADQGQRQQDPLLAALEKLLTLPQARVTANEVIDLLHVAALRRRFGIGDEQLPLLRQWIEAAGVRWGLHAQHRASLALPPGMEQNSWASGLRRMLLGYAVGAGQAWNAIEPLEDVGGLEAALLGPLVRLLDALEGHWQSLQLAASPHEWSSQLRQLLDDFFDAADGSADGLTLLRAQAALDDWEQACAAAGLVEALPLSVVREHWLGCMEPPDLKQPFFGGGVTFASLMPMRAIPFRWVGLLGMNDGDYPRSRVPMDFDLMAGDHRAGDRSRREDDRYLFLEALLSAREHLHVSWVGRSIHDNEERPPSVLVAQLRDHVAAGWRLQDGDGPGLLRTLTVEHRLQPFHPAYFDGSVPGLFSHASEWRASLAAPGAAEGGCVDPLAARPGPHALTLRQLGDFLKHPARAFLQQRLGIVFRDEDPVAEDEEPFGIDALVNWKLQAELILAQRAAVDAGRSREDALQAQLARIALRGELPHGAFAAPVLQELQAPMERLFDQYARAVADWPNLLQEQAVEYAGVIAGVDVRMEDWLAGLRADSTAARRARLVLENSSLVANRRYRFDRLLPHWAAHLAGHLQGQPLTTIILSKAGRAVLPPLPLDEARAAWTVLLQAWEEGMRRPLPFDVQGATAYLKALEPRKGRPPEPDAPAKAREAVQACYEQQRDRDICLARAYQDFDALWCGGEFARWTEALLQPLRHHLGPPPKDDSDQGAE